MSALGYESLRTAKAALDEGLINTRDFDEVKAAFLRAQQIKAGLDAGFIHESDYQNVKKAFFASLKIDAHPTTLSGAFPSSSAKQNGDSSSLQPSQQYQGAQSNSQRKQSGAASQDQAAPNKPKLPDAALAAPPVPALAPRTTEPMSSPEQQQQLKTVVPTNIPKMGGARPKQTGGTSMSGIAVTEDAVNLYYYLKAKQVYRWATWKINDVGNKVVIADVGDKKASYSDFLQAFPASDCRYGVIDMKFTNSEGCVFNKILFVNWAPDSAKIKAKMMYASTKDFFKGYLDGLSIELQGSDLEDISEVEANGAVRSSVTRQ